MSENKEKDKKEDVTKESKTRTVILKRASGLVKRRNGVTFLARVGKETYRVPEKYFRKINSEGNFEVEEKVLKTFKRA